MPEDRRSTVKFPIAREVRVSEIPPPREDPPKSSKPPVSSSPLSSSPLSMRPSYIDPEWVESETSVTRPTETSLPAHTPVAARDRALLTVLTGLNAGQVFTIDTDETTIGRGRDVAVRIEDVGI